MMEVMVTLVLELIGLSGSNGPVVEMEATQQANGNIYVFTIHVGIGSSQATLVASEIDPKTGVLDSREIDSAPAFGLSFLDVETAPLVVPGECDQNQLAITYTKAASPSAPAETRVCLCPDGGCLEPICDSVKPPSGRPAAESDLGTSGVFDFDEPTGSRFRCVQVDDEGRVFDFGLGLDQCALPDEIQVGDPTESDLLVDPQQGTSGIRVRIVEAPPPASQPLNELFPACGVLYQPVVGSDPGVLYCNECHLRLAQCFDRTISLPPNASARGATTLWTDTRREEQGLSVHDEADQEWFRYRAPEGSGALGPPIRFADVEDPNELWPPAVLLPSISVAGGDRVHVFVPPASADEEDNEDADASDPPAGGAEVIDLEPVATFAGTGPLAAVKNADPYRSRQLLAYVGLDGTPRLARITATCRPGERVLCLGDGRFCATDADTLCVTESRFEIEIEFETAGGVVPGRAQQLTAESGYFWFLNADNVEVVIKVLKACGINQRYWVFAAGLTNQGVRIDVRDIETGFVRSYLSPQGQAFQAILDTANGLPCS